MHQLLNLDCYSIIAYLPPTMAFYPTVGDRIPILLDYLDLGTDK
ncbi:MAG: hypothetical protein ACYTXC_05540 [Nostoc sp.]